MTNNKLIPITKPTLPSHNTLKDGIKSIINSGMITNSKYVQRFEEAVKTYIGCRHAIAVSSCTSGLMMLLRALDVKGEVILPSFTFYATGHAVLWNNLKPVFVDCNPETYNIDPAKIEQAITPDTSTIIAVHMFGNPANVEALEQIAKKHNLKLIFDAAHGFGSTYKGKKLGNFGDAECFSSSPTKLITAGEGGIVATDNDELAKKIKIGRTYGDPGNYDCEFLGLSARMPEISGLLGIKSVEILEANVENRNRLVEKYKARLSQLPGITFQKINQENRTNYKDFSIFIDKEKMGIDRDSLANALAGKNIMARKYFYPPLHQQKLFAKYYNQAPHDLSATEKISSNVLSLPLYSHMAEEEVERVCNAMERIINKT